MEVYVTSITSCTTMTYSIDVARVGEPMHFRARTEDGLTIDMDNGPAGPSPMQLLIMAMGGCSGIDIVDILQKYRQPLEDFSMTLEAERTQRDTYSEFTHIHAHYRLTGALDPDKVRRAIELSLGKYCSVSKALEKTATITYAFSVNDQHFDTAEATA